MISSPLQNTEPQENAADLVLGLASTSKAK